LADVLVEQWQLSSFERSGAALVAEGTHLGCDAAVIKPQTYMNRSGRVVAPLATEGIDLQADLLVVVDDFALPLGAMRLRARGSAGGHNGLESIEKALDTDAYARLRIGIGPVPERQDPADFVLEPFSKTELRELVDLLPDLHDAVECWLAEGIEEAMNRYNKRGPQRE
jgi:PTH1 family peptidyl-tRNA hydrolase